MPYDPRMYEPNPGRDPGTNIHQWDQPLNPRGDMPMQAPGVDPMSFRTRAEYESARNAALAHQREMAYRAQTGQFSSPTLPSTVPHTPSRQFRTQKIQPVEKKKPDPPKPRYTPVGYLVYDNRKPSYYQFYTEVIGKVASRAFLTATSFFFLSITFSRYSLVTQLSIAVIVSMLCWVSVFYRAENHSVDAKKWPGTISIRIGVLAVAGVNLFGGLNASVFSWSTLVAFGIGLFVVATAPLAEADDIFYGIVNKNWHKRLFENAAQGQKCRLCGEPAVAMRRYFFSSPNEWKYYIPVCTKHQHYICEIDGFGNQTWPQSGDCTQTGLVRATPKRFPKNVHPQRHR